MKKKQRLTVQLQVRLTEEMSAHLDEKAAEHGTDRAGYVRSLLSEGGLPQVVITGKDTVFLLQEISDTLMALKNRFCP